jgi:hypothetical protein
MAKVLAAADIVSAKSRDVSRVAVPQWGGDVFIRGMSLGEREKFERWVRDRSREDSSPDDGGIRAALVCMALCDEQGNRLFTLDDAKQFSEHHWAPLEMLVAEIDKIDAISERAIKELKELFVKAHSGDSSSSSPQS